MSKSVEEVRRDAFEAAYSKLDQQAAQHLLFVRDDGQYGYHTTRTAWGCFNAALDAVEIKLPEPHSTNGGDCVADYDECRAAIEQTGLGLRVL